MLVNRLLLAASVATALLVLPDTSDNKDGIFRTLPVDTKTYDVPTNALTQSLELPCRKCRGHGSHLKLDFRVEDSTRLVLNGFELYPNADPWQGDLIASVVREDGESVDRRLGYGLAIRPMGIDEDQKLELIGLELLIIEVGDRFIDNVPPVSVKLIKSLSGEILIGSIDLIEYSIADTDDSCSSAWCRVSGVLGHYWNGLKSKFKGTSCKGMQSHHKVHKGHKGHQKDHHKGHRHGKHKSGHENKVKHHGDKTHHHGHYGHHGYKHHHHGHSWSVVKHVVSYIFLPIIIGMTAGVAVAVYVSFLSIACTAIVELTRCRITMFIGTLIMRFIRLIRGERRELPLYVDRKMDIIEFLATDEEKASLAQNQEAPPQYEDEPARH
ncbi:hypothetical protein BGZ63DRAFT_377912 [Mariannaea sp. PMI_226]|nr:hypothetical protein BGZ63DRAFT_377912 [Mariannaea sp. PMI_226]